MFATVVVPLDGSVLAENALAAGTAVARRCGARLLLVQVVRHAHEEPETAAALSSLAAGVFGARAETRCLRGRDAAQAIAELAATTPDALVCMSTHGRGGVGRALVGSVAEDVIRRHGGPVLLVGPSADIGAVPLDGRVLVCLDGSALAEQVLPLARRWAEAFGMGLELVQVVAPGAGGGHSPAGSDAEHGHSPAGSDAVGDHYLAGCGRPLHEAGVDVGWTVLRGQRAAAVIAEHVERHRPGLVALSTHGRAGLARLAAGSVAMTVVHHSPRPVLVHRPAGEPGA